MFGVVIMECVCINTCVGEAVWELCWKDTVVSFRLESSLTTIASEAVPSFPPSPSPLFEMICSVCF